VPTVNLTVGTTKARILPVRCCRNHRAPSNRRQDLATPCRVEAQAPQLQLDANAQSAQQRGEAALEEVVRRRHRVVGATAERDAAGLGAEHQRGQHRLQHQRAAAGRANVEGVVARTRFPRLEDQGLRAEFGAFHPRGTDRRGGLHAGEVLAHQPRLRTLRTDALDREGLAGAHRQGQRRPQDLAAAFAGRAIEFNHVHFLLVHSSGRSRPGTRPASSCQAGMNQEAPAPRRPRVHAR